MTTCPVCKQDWPSASVYDRIRAWQRLTTDTATAQQAQVGRNTYLRVRAGIRVSWPDFLAVMSAAGVSLEEARAAHATAKRQKGGAKKKRAAGKSDQFRNVPDGESCGWHYMTVGYVRGGKVVRQGIEEYRGYCALPDTHVLSGDNHKFDRSVQEPEGATA